MISAPQCETVFGSPRLGQRIRNTAGRGAGGEGLRLAIAFVVLLLFGALASVNQAAEVARPLVVVGRPVVSAQLAELTESGDLRFAVTAPDGGPAQPLVVPRADLVAWGTPAEFERRTYIMTVDGGVMAVDTVAVTSEQLELTSTFFEPRSLPLSVVRGIVFHAPSARAARDRLFRSLAASGAGDRDRLLLAGGEEVSGTLSSLDSRHANIESSVGPAKIDLNRVAAVVFNPALAARVELPPERLVVGLLDGSLFVTTKAVGREIVQLSPIALSPPLVDAGESSKPWNVDRAEIVFLQSLGGRATYLSDLTSLGYKHVPYLELPREYRLDRSPAGGDLRAGERRYLKGVSMHSTSRLTFPIAAGDKRFAAEIAIDDETSGRGSVTFRVFVDAEERFRSEVVRGGDAPNPIEVDVAGGKQLSLIVDFAEEGDVLDHADWLNARLEK